MLEPSPYFIRRVNPSLVDEVSDTPSSVILSSSNEPNFWEYWRTIRKHGRLVLTLLSTVLLLTCVVVFSMTPIYTAQSTIIIESQAPQILDIRELIAEQPEGEAHNYYETQYQILQSRSIATRVISELGLQQDPSFTGEITEQGLVSRIRAAASGWAAQLLPLPSADTTQRKLPEEAGIKPEIFDLYSKRLEIKPVPATRLVVVAFSTPDPVLSAQIVNAHVSEYITQGMDLRAQTSEYGAKFLQNKLVELKQRIQNSEAALNAYRRDRGIVALPSDDKGKVIMQRLADLNRALTQAETERIALEAQAGLMRTRDYESLPEVNNSTLIQTLKAEKGHIDAEYASLANQFKPDYPPVAQLAAKSNEAQHRLDEEIRRVASGVESSYRAALERENALRREVRAERDRTLALNDASLQDAILAREVEASHELYKSVLARMNEMAVAAEVRASNVSVVDKAVAPARPSRPRKLLAVAISGFLTLFLGTGLAFFVDQLDDSLKGPEDVQRYVGVPTLGMVPGFGVKRYGPAAYLPSRASGSQPEVGGERTTSKEIVVSRNPFSLPSEAYRTLRTAILLSRAAAAPKSILITSATAQEGKTVTAVNTAVAFAQNGSRVLLIDADLRRARCHELMHLDNHIGLTEILVGSRKPEEPVRPTDIDMLFFLSAGSVPPNPSELLGSKKMMEELSILQAQYQYIIIDSPPLLPVSDSLLISTMVDGVLVVVGPQTPKKMVRIVCSRLSEVGARVLGVVLNRISSRDVGYYHGDYSVRYHPYQPHGSETDASRARSPKTRSL